MNVVRRHKGWVIAVGMVLLLGIAGLIGVAGCGGSEMVTTTAGATATTAVPWDQAGMTVAEAPGDAGSATDDRDPSAGGIDPALAGTLGALQKDPSQKIITTAQLDIEVESGKFQSVFSQALLLADRYGGYVMGSNSQASGLEDSMKSGTVTIRVPVDSFGQAMNEAGRLGEVKNQYIATEDVTEEYVDLQARITNSEAKVQRLLELLSKAQTVNEILQVQQVVTSAQEELEQLKGRQRYLDAHTSYSTLTMNIYEKGVEVVVETPPPNEWGFVAALKDALHNFVDAISQIARGLGWLIPILVVIAVVLFIIYLGWRRVSQRNKAKALEGYRPYASQGPVGQHGASGAPVQPGAPESPPLDPRQSSAPGGESGRPAGGGGAK